jgi:hypothetical protein
MGAFLTFWWRGYERYWVLRVGREKNSAEHDERKEGMGAGTRRDEDIPSLCCAIPDAAQSPGNLQGATAKTREKSFGAANGVKDTVSRAQPSVFIGSASDDRTSKSDSSCDGKQ